MELFSIASGSSGNCICVGNDDNHIMIDAGISGKAVEGGMNQMGFTTSDMDAILVTHEHADHIKGLGVVMRKYGLPVYATEKTIDAMIYGNMIGKVDTSLFRPIHAGDEFDIGSLHLKAMHISHDAADPVAYIFNDDKSRGAVVTDLGIYDGRTISELQGLDAILLEANHDIRMLELGPYPYPLKQRILSDHGHLSNELSGQLLCEILHDDLKHVLLGHLSGENNYPRLAYQAVVAEITLGDNPYKGSDFHIEVAPRGDISPRLEF